MSRTVLQASLEWIEGKPKINNEYVDVERTEDSRHFLDLMVTEMRDYEVSDLHNKIAASVKQQLINLKNDFPRDEDYRDKLNCLYRYFCNLYHHLKSKLELEQVAGDAVGLARILASQYEQELYLDDSITDDLSILRQKIADIGLHAMAAPQALLNRVFTYVDCLSGVLYGAMSEYVLFFPAIKPVDRHDRTAVDYILHRRGSNEVENMATSLGLMRRNTPVKRGEELLQAPQIVSGKTSPTLSVVLAAATCKTACTMNLRTKWQHLSGGQRLLFGLITAVAIVGAVAAAVFVPGSALVVIPALGVFTLKVLAILLGVAVVTTTVGGIYRRVSNEKSELFINPEVVNSKDDPDVKPDTNRCAGNHVASTVL